ncbi:VOC family protein [Streptomyces sp. NPDC008139]|uniref:VOC family protein n=1 Tax=Streptomyces sp. NPDC008139 TaxID=3364814 RepID=UPI0036EA7283
MSEPTAPLRTTFTAVVLDAPDATALADFYRRLLGWEVTAREPDWVKLNPPGGGTGLSFQTEPLYTPPTWPSAPAAQQMMLHLDFEVTDLSAGTATALACGAVLAAYQPEDDTRIFLDPAGHPFCLWVRTDV